MSLHIIQTEQYPCLPTLYLRGQFAPSLDLKVMSLPLISDQQEAKRLNQAQTQNRERKETQVVVQKDHIKQSQEVIATSHDLAYFVSVVIMYAKDSCLFCLNSGFIIACCLYI